MQKAGKPIQNGFLTKSIMAATPVEYILLTMRFLIVNAVIIHLLTKEFVFTLFSIFLLKIEFITATIFDAILLQYKLGCTIKPIIAGTIIIVLSINCIQPILEKELYSIAITTATISIMIPRSEVDQLTVADSVSVLSPLVLSAVMYKNIIMHN